MLRRASPAPAPLRPLASTLPVRSYRCARLLIPGVVPLRRSSWNEPVPFRLGARPGARCRCAPPRCLTAHRPVTPHRILRLLTASLPCSPDALDPHPLSRPSGRHDERVPLRPCHAATGGGVRTARPALCSSARAIGSSVASVRARGTSSPKAGVVVGLRARTGCGPRPSLIGADRDPPVSHPFDMARSRDRALFTPHCDVIAARIPCCNSCQLVLAGFSPLHAAGAPHGGRLGHRGPHAEPRNAAPGTTRISLLRMPRSTRGTVTPSSAGSRTTQLSPAARRVARGDTIGRTPLDEGVGLPGSGCRPSRARSPPTPERSSPAPRAPPREPARGCWASCPPSAGSPACSSGR